jgi:predicted dehydrogenase
VKALRLLVVGAGHMGRLHAAKIASLGAREGGLVLAGVADRHPERARLLTDEWGGRPAADLEELAAEADAGVVAVPGVAHAAVAQALLEAGLDVLVEKPIAATVAEAEDLLDRARSAGRLLLVGHLEWFNPALRAVAPAVRRPRFAEARRLGPFPGRATDVDVVRDLMIHDIDVIQRLLGEEPLSVEGFGVPVLSEQVDVASARLRFPSGCVADLTASRVSPSPVRELRLFQADGGLVVDFLTPSATALRRAGGPDDPPGLAVERIALEAEDALEAQLRDFVAAVRSRRDPTGSAGAGLRALRTALRVVDSIPAFPVEGT